MKYGIIEKMNCSAENAARCAGLPKIRQGIAMLKFLFLLLWPGILLFLGSQISCERQELVFGRQETRLMPFMAIISFIPLIWIAGTRTSFVDTATYISIYRTLPGSLGQISGYLETVTKDKGFTVFSIFIKSLFGNDYKIYFSIIAILQGAALIAVYRKYSENFLLALFVFIASTDYMSWMHNGIRQFLAVTVTFAATPLLLQKKYVPYFLVVLLASTFHQTALMMIPIAFIVQGKAWNKRSLLAIAAVSFAIAFTDQFTDFLDAALADTQYTNVVSDWSQGGDDGTNLLRVLVYAVPTILSIVGLPYIQEADDPVVNLSCNMGILSTMLYCLSAVTSGIFIGRLPIYCSLYSSGILLPWLLRHMFSKGSQKFVYGIMIAAYSLFYYYQMHMVWGVM